MAEAALPSKRSRPHARTHLTVGPRGAAPPALSPAPPSDTPAFRPPPPSGLAHGRILSRVAVRPKNLPQHLETIGGRPAYMPHPNPHIGGHARAPATSTSAAAASFIITSSPTSTTIVVTSGTSYTATFLTSAPASSFTTAAPSSINTASCTTSYTPAPASPPPAPPPAASAARCGSTT